MRRLATALLLAFFCALTSGYATAATTVISPDPLLHFVDNNGNPLIGGKLFTYAAGTTTKQATYTDYSGGTPNTDPIILNARGEANVWLDPTLSYKFVLAPATDSDPPTNPIWTVDNIIGLTATPMPIPIAQGGTGATTAAGALANLGVTSTSVNCSAQSGSDAGAMINACLAVACPGSNNGVADATGIVGAQTVAESIEVPSTCTLLFGTSQYTFATGQNISLGGNDTLRGQNSLDATKITGSVAGLGIVDINGTTNNVLENLNLTNTDHSAPYDESTSTGGSAALRIIGGGLNYVHQVTMTGGVASLTIAANYYNLFDHDAFGSLGTETDAIYLFAANSNTFNAPRILIGTPNCIDNEFSTGVTFIGLDCESATNAVLAEDIGANCSECDVAQTAVFGGYIEAPLANITLSAAPGGPPPSAYFYNLSFFTARDCTGVDTNYNVLASATIEKNAFPSCTIFGNEFGAGGLSGPYFASSNPSIDLFNTTNNYEMYITNDTTTGNLQFHDQFYNYLPLEAKRLDIANSTITTITGTSGTAACFMPMQGDYKTVVCALNGYAQTGTAQTYTFPTGFQVTPTLDYIAAWADNPTATTGAVTLPAAGGMSPQTGNIVMSGN